MSLLTLSSFEHCQKLLNLDERDQAQIELLMFSCTAEIESYTHRCLAQRELWEHHNGDLNSSFLLKEYPVTTIQSLYCSDCKETYHISKDYYSTSPPLEHQVEKRVRLFLTQGYHFPKGRGNIQVQYTPGYSQESMPEDLKMALCEMVEWNLKRIRLGQVGMSGLTNSLRTKEWPVSEKGMPEHVRELLEPYRRKGW